MRRGDIERLKENQELKEREERERKDKEDREMKEEAAAIKRMKVCIISLSVIR
jgi:hypothetical protein